MDNNNNNENNRQNVNYEPLNAVALNELLRKSKGIESLWKKIKDSKDKKKSSLYEYEKDLVELFNTFTESFKKVAEEYDKINGKALDLGKSMQSKEAYKVMVTKFLPNTGEADAFVKKFPHWTIQVCSLFTNSTHYKRISTGVSGAKLTTKNITDSSIFDVKKKDGGKKTGYESEKTNKGILKKINLFWNRYFKRGGWGKASKSKVTIELKKFGDYVNKPWRKWWELICPSGEKLSNSEPKSLLKEALGKSTPNAQKKALLNLFNMGSPIDGSEEKATKHNQHISGFSDLSNFNQGSFKNQLNVMFDVFTSLDKSLGNEVRQLFGEPPIEDKSAIGKVWDKTKGMFGGNKKGANQNINLNESSKGFTNEPASQTSGNNLTFDNNKSANFKKINNLVQQIKSEAKYGSVDSLVQIANAVTPKIDYEKAQDRVKDYLKPIADFIGLNCDEKYINGTICKDSFKSKSKDQDTANAENLIKEIRDMIVACYSKLNVIQNKGNGLPKNKK